MEFHECFHLIVINSVNYLAGVNTKHQIRQFLTHKINSQIQLFYESCEEWLIIQAL